MRYNPEEWKAEIASQAEHYLNLYDHLPKELVFQKELATARLA